MITVFKTVLTALFMTILHVMTVLTALFAVFVDLC